MPSVTRIVDVIQNPLNGRTRIDDGHAGWRVEVEGAWGDLGIWFFACEREPGDRAVGLLEFNGGDRSLRGHGQVEAGDSFLLALWLAPQLEAPVGRGSDGEVVDFLFKLRVPQEKAKRRAQVVELLGGNALYLLVS